MFFKSFLGIFFVATLFMGSYWLMAFDSERNDTGNVSTDYKIAISSEVQKLKKPGQQNKQSAKGKKAKENEFDRILTPDELYEQRFNGSQTELEPTIPELEVIPEELKIVEQEAASASVSEETFREDELLDDPAHLNHIFLEDELPPSENYKEVIPYELEQMESKFVNIKEN